MSPAHRVPSKPTPSHTLCDVPSAADVESPSTDVAEPTPRRQPQYPRPPVPSPLRLDVWSEHAVDDEDRALIEELRGGHHPFADNVVVNCVTVVGSNYVDDAAFDETTESIEADLAGGLIRELRVGESAYISGRGTVPKPDGKLRPVHNLVKVNELLGELPPLSYQSVDVARANLQRGWFGAKIDIRKAYRSVPVSDRTSRFLGYRWPRECHCVVKWRPPRGTLRCAAACPRCGWRTFLEQRLPFGLASCCEFFDRISRFIQRWWYRSRSQAHAAAFLVVYLDDLFIGAPTEAMVWAELLRLVAFIEQLGFEENENKRCPPAQRIVFLGIQLDTISMTASIPVEKLRALVDRLSVVERAASISIDELASLVGSASWCARVVFGARTFSRRLIDLLTRLRDSGARSCLLTPEVTDDLAWWRRFAARFNEQPMSPLSCARDSNFFATDAALEPDGAGIGGVYIVGRQVYRFAFGPSMLDLPRVGALSAAQRDLIGIHHLELLAVLEAASRWAPMWHGRHVRVFCDNTIVVAWIVKGSCRDQLGLAWLRELFWLAVEHSFRLTAARISSTDNALADSLSRGQSARFVYLLRRWRASYGDAAEFGFEAFQQSERGSRRAD